MELRPWIMRPVIGIASLKTVSTNPGRLADLIAFSPRSDIARLIDFVKFNGTVASSRGSNHTVSQVRTTIKYEDC